MIPIIEHPTVKSRKYKYRFSEQTLVQHVSNFLKLLYFKTLNIWERKSLEWFQELNAILDQYFVSLLQKERFSPAVKQILLSSTNLFYNAYKNKMD